MSTAASTSVPEMIVVRTRWSWIVFRLLLGVGLLLAPSMVASSGDPVELGDAFVFVVGIPFGLLLLCYRVREQAVLGRSGIKLGYSLFELGPFRLAKRETVVGWGRVLYVHDVVSSYPFSLYRVEINDGSRKSLDWVIGLHVTNHEAALDMLARRTGRMDPFVYKKVRRWRRMGIV